MCYFLYFSLQTNTRAVASDRFEDRYTTELLTQHLGMTAVYKRTVTLLPTKIAVLTYSFIDATIAAATAN